MFRIAGEHLLSDNSARLHFYGAPTFDCLALDRTNFERRPSSDVYEIADEFPLKVAGHVDHLRNLSKELRQFWVNADSSELFI